MKKPEEIKKGLECCANSSFCDEECPYFEECNEGLESHATDALSYIQQLEAENHQLLTKAKQSEAQVTRWISAKTPPKEWRENDKDGTLINFQVYSPEYGVDIGNWVETAKMWVIMGLPAKVTHWMPLPKAPKEDAHAAD